MANNLWQGVPTDIGARERSELDRRAAVERVIAAMRERLDRPFALDEMARIAFLSRFYFNRIFREVTGLPPVRFQTALRIAEAKRLLLSTDMSVTEVCFELGYQSLGTFTTHFHELVGVSPRELRRAVSPAAPLPAVLAEPLARSAGQHGMPTVEGELLGGRGDGTALLGLFRQPNPQGRPLACSVLAGPGRYELHTDARGMAFVAAIVPEPGEGPPLVALMRQPVQLGTGRANRRDLRLRPIQPTDPPILLVIPGLHEHGIPGHQPMPDAAGTLIAQ